MGTKEDILELVFPPGTFEWFELTEGKRSEDDKTTHITLTEKDLPPLTEENKDKKIVAKKLHDITITDFPLRGRQTLLTFRRRYWKLEGQEEYLKRDIKLANEATSLVTIARSQKIPAKEFEKQYKNHLSGFKNWDQKEPRR